MPRIISLHYLRGLAALIVVIGHVLYFPFDPAIQTQYLGAATIPQYAADDPLLSLQLFQYMPSGSFPVAMFFLLSGFVIEGALRALPPAKFIVNRAFRIYPAFFACCALYLLMMLALHSPMPAAHDIWSNVFLIDRSFVPVSWTLLIEVRYYIVTAAMVALQINGLSRAWLLLAALVLAPSIFIWPAFMALGVIAYYLFEAVTQARFRDARKCGIVLIAYVICWFAIGEWKMQIISSPVVPWSELVGAMMVFALSLIIWRHTRESRVLAFLGDVSYPLYAGQHVAIVLAYGLLVGRVPLALIAVVALAAALLLAWAIHLTVELPAMRFSKWLLKPKRSRDLAPQVVAKPASAT